MIALIDYGVGNLRSVEKALQTIGASVVTTRTPAEIFSAGKVVLPGVGAFKDSIQVIKSIGLDGVIRQVCAEGKPLLGICLGMQLLFESSEESGNWQGLGLLPGAVRRFPESGLKIPHTGWNQIIKSSESALLRGVPDGSYAYFNHSYYCEAAENDSVLACTDYGIRFPSVVGRDNIYGAQFHPEKSQLIGLQILKNFVERC